MRWRTESFPDCVYSDEDKIDGRGQHFELYCKPDFSPELLLTQMYLCHFTIFRTERVRSVGGLRSEMDGAQDFDLALRLLPELTRVVHLPRPLYHWRAWSESTALTIDAKPWAQEAAARAQQAHLDRTFGGGLREAERRAGSQRGASPGGRQPRGVGHHPDHRHSRTMPAPHGTSTTPCGH